MQDTQERQDIYRGCSVSYGLQHVVILNGLMYHLYYLHTWERYSRGNRSYHYLEYFIQSIYSYSFV